MTQIEEIKTRLDLVEVVREYVPNLTRVGDNWRACCPFHQEKSPSFMVSQSKQIWHCFGCSEGGDVFGFVMKMEGIEFKDALYALAQRAGVVLVQENIQERSQKAWNQDLHETVTQFYINTLWNAPEAHRARTYLLEERLLTRDTLNQFRIGFSPSGWDTTSQWLLKKGFTEDQLLKSGLVVERSQERQQQNQIPFYDRFRGRIMFPLVNIHGGVVGFGGRILNSEDATQPKYLNSAQTVLYDKSSYLYGLDKAKQEIRTKNRAIVVEGYMDVIASHQAGVNYAVGVCGTALTPQHVTLLKRWTTNLVLVFDRDKAGRVAAHKASRLAASDGVTVWALDFQQVEGKDPDEIARSHPDIWKNICDNPQLYVDVMSEEIMRYIQVVPREQKQRLVNRLYEELAITGNSMVAVEWLRQLSQKEGVPYNVCWEQFETYKDKMPKTQQFNVSKEVKSLPKERIATEKSQQEAISLELITILVGFPDDLIQSVRAMDSTLLAPKLQSLYNNIIRRTQLTVEERASFVFSSVEDQHQYELFEMRAHSDWLEVDKGHLLSTAETLIRRLKRINLMENLGRLKEEMRALERQSEASERVATLTQECADINNQLSILE